MHEAVLNLRPEHPASNSVVSGNIATSNLLLQVQVPKMIGRKRKRDAPSSQDQMAHLEGNNPEAIPMIDSLPSRDRLLQALNDHHNNFEFSAVGLVERTHRFRSKYLIK